MDELYLDEALECMNNLDNMEFSRSIETYVPLIDSDISETQYLCNTDEFYIVKQALLKAKKAEKEKLLFKNLQNTKVKLPLVSIFNGLSQEERFKFTEHIYYNWEEKKEALEDENQKLEEENKKLKDKNVEYNKALKLLFDRKVDIYHLSKSKTAEDYNSIWENSTYCLTDAEFDSLKRLNNNVKN